MPHSSLGNVSLYGLTSRKRNTLRRSSLVGSVVVAEAVAVVGAVHRGKSVTSVPMSSVLKGLLLQLVDSVSPSPSVFLRRTPPASEPDAPRSKLPALANPTLDSALIFVR